MDHQAVAQMLGNYGEFVGSIGVVATLVYLAIQIRQNTATSRGLSRQTLIDGWAVSQAQFQSNPELLRIYAKGIMQWSTMSNTEKTQFDVGMAQFLGNLTKRNSSKRGWYVGSSNFRRHRRFHAVLYPK
ncbi:MAG: hypothetical protein O7H39_08165 [Gammaproteobacteria bacterium]|nr:hypothetical protein [Gammaproteobacteria bacterium]